MTDSNAYDLCYIKKVMENLICAPCRQAIWHTYCILIFGIYTVHIWMWDQHDIIICATWPCYMSHMWNATSLIQIWHTKIQMAVLHVTLQSDTHDVLIFDTDVVHGIACVEDTAVSISMVLADRGSLVRMGYFPLKHEGYRSWFLKSKWIVVTAVGRPGNRPTTIAIGAPLRQKRCV